MSICSKDMFDGAFMGSKEDLLSRDTPQSKANFDTVGSGLNTVDFDNNLDKILNQKSIFMSKPGLDDFTFNKKI